MYCIVLWACDHILDRSACDCKVSNTDMGKLFTVKCGTITSIVWWRMLSGLVAATCHSPWNLVYVHPPEFLARIFSLPAGNTSGFPCGIVSCSLLMHVHCCCWNGLARFSYYYIKILHVLTWIQIYTYTGCPRRNVRDFRRLFLILNYTDITQNTYVRNWTVTEIMEREKCGLLAGPCTVRRPWRHTCPMHLPDQRDMVL